jgi:hypothetical protein
MRTVFRPFLKVIDVIGNAVSGVELKDSTGSLVSCNFVSVTTSGGANTDGAVIILEPSAMTSNVPLGSSALDITDRSKWTPDGASAVDGAGALGDSCAPGGTAQLVLGIGDRVECVFLSNISTAGGTVKCLVTYGNVNVQNPLKDGDWGRGS